MSHWVQGRYPKSSLLANFSVGTATAGFGGLATQLGLSDTTMSPLTRKKTRRPDKRLLKLKVDSHYHIFSILESKTQMPFLCQNRIFLREIGGEEG